MTKEPTSYEIQAIREIHAWKNPEISWLDKSLEAINWPADKAAKLISAVPGADVIISKTVGGLVSILNDLAHWSISPDRIFKEFHNMGHDVTGSADIFRLDLENVDRVIGWLGAKYKGMAAVEGAAVGVVGLPGIPADVVALVTMNQRAIGEYATYCGFDISIPGERLFALNVLELAASPNRESKNDALGHLNRIARDAASERSGTGLETSTIVGVIQKMANTLGSRLIKAKATQMLPAIGAGVSASFNAYYTSQVCDAAYFLYRERFLAAKYGPDIIDVTVHPVDDLMRYYDDI